MLDLHTLLAPLGVDAPAGRNLEYEAIFQTLDQSSRATPDQQIGESIIAGREPDWRDVKSQAIAIAAETKDLRVAVVLTKSLLHVDGFSGLAAGLAYVHGLLEQYWDAVHPILDADDGFDPAIRVHAIEELIDPAFIERVRGSRLVGVRQHGRFSLYDVEKNDNGASIEAAFREVEITELATTRNEIAGAIDHIDAIEAVIFRQADSIARLAPLKQILTRACEHLDARLRSRTIEETSAPVVGRSDGVPKSREDVVRLLDQVSEYYERHERSSPVPLLVERCRKLVHMNFLEIMENVAPDGLDQVHRLQGPRGDET